MLQGWQGVWRVTLAAAFGRDKPLYFALRLAEEGASPEDACSKFPLISRWR